MDWLSEVKAESERAEKARAKGNEGQARVCARRAAGIAAREYYAGRGQPIRTSNAYDVLKIIVQDSQVPAPMRESAALLTLRVDEQFKLPPDVDLVAEARRFCESVASMLER